jgi:hypothetical protein
VAEPHPPAPSPIDTSQGRWPAARAGEGVTGGRCGVGRCYAEDAIYGVRAAEGVS